MSGALAPIARGRGLGKLRAAALTHAPMLGFGLRLWASMCLALYLAFRLELDGPALAATSAAFACQPQLGASLRKGWFRMIGTVVGAIAAVSLTAAFPQDRVAFLLLLALWGGACAMAATLLRNFASYAAALAGFTAATIISDELGAVGGPDGTVFTLALTRVTEVCLGIVCAGSVLTITDVGTSRRRLAELLATLIADIAHGLVQTLVSVGPQPSDTQEVRRDLLRRVIALDPAMDEAMGESADIRNRSLTLQAAIAGAFTALGAWRAIALRLKLQPGAALQVQAAAILDTLSPGLRCVASQGKPVTWQRHAMVLREQAVASSHHLSALPTRCSSERLLTDNAARAFAGLAETINGLALLVRAPIVSPAGQGRWQWRIADWLPALVNAGRSAIAILGVQLLWIVTAWPGGGVAMVWTTIVTALFAPRADQAYAGALGYMIGAVVALSAAALLGFVILPQLTGFAAFGLVLAAYLIPAGTLMASGWRPPVAIGMVGTMVAFLMPTNEMVYNSQAFYNNALALLIGNGAALMSFRLIPPIPPAVRAQRLLRLSLRDVRSLARTPGLWRIVDWQARLYSRLAALPEQAEPVQRARLLAALDLGSEMLRLNQGLHAARHHLEAPRPESDDLVTAFRAIAEGRSGAAIDALGQLDARLAADGPGAAEDQVRQSASIIGIVGVLRAHAAFFDAGENP